MAWLIAPLTYASVWVQGAHYQIDHYTLFGVIMMESAFDHHAVGDNRSSFGLWQLHVQGAGHGHPIVDLLDPYRSTEIAVAHLASLQERVGGDMRDALSAYNQGFGGWQQRGRDYNQGYWEGVLAWAERFRASGIGPDPGRANGYGVAE